MEHTLSPNESLSILDSPGSISPNKFTLGGSPHFIIPPGSLASPQSEIPSFAQQKSPSQKTLVTPITPITPISYSLNIHNIEDSSFRAYSFRNPTSGGRQSTNHNDPGIIITTPISTKSKDENKTLPNGENITFQGTQPDYSVFHANVVINTEQSGTSHPIPTSKSMSKRGTNRRPSNTSKLSKLELTEDIISKIDDSKKISYQTIPKISMEPILSEMEGSSPGKIDQSTYMKESPMEKSLRAANKNLEQTYKKQFFNLTGLENESLYDQLARMGNRNQIARVMIKEQIKLHEEMRLREIRRQELAVREKSDNQNRMMKHYSKLRQNQFRLNNISIDHSEDLDVSQLSSHLESFKLEPGSKSKTPRPLQALPIPAKKTVSFAVENSKTSFKSENMKKNFTFSSALSRRIIPDKQEKAQKRPKRTLYPSKFVYKVYKLPRDPEPEVYGINESVHYMGSFYHQVQQFTNVKTTLPKIGEFGMVSDQSSETLTLFNTIKNSIETKDRSKSYDSRVNLIPTTNEQDSENQRYNTELKKLLKMSVYKGT